MILKKKMQTRSIIIKTTGRNIEVSADLEDKISIKCGESIMGCWEEDCMDFISVKSLQLFLNNQEKMFNDKANMICAKRKQKLDALEKKNSELNKENKLLQNNIEMLKHSITILK